MIEDVYGLGVRGICRGLLSPMRNASAKSFEMEAPTNNNLPNQTGDVIANPINPENPDSKSGCKYVISIED